MVVAARPRRRRPPRPRGQPDDVVVAPEAVTRVALPHRRLDLAVGRGGGEREGVEHLLDGLAEAALVLGARLRLERAPLGDDVAARTADDRADVRGRLVVDPAEPQVGDRLRGGLDGLGFDGDLYGERLVVEVWSLLREQSRFDSLEELVAAIAADVERTRLAERPA